MLNQGNSQLIIFFCMLLLYAMVIVRIAAIYIVHFPIASTHPRDANIWLETAKMLVPVLSWVVACYAISSISDGETLIGETFAAASYAIIPYIVFSIPLMFFSRIMGRSLLLLYDSLNAIMWLWVILVVFISVKTLNDYTLWQTTKVCVISIAIILITHTLVVCQSV